MLVIATLEENRELLLYVIAPFRTVGWIKDAFLVPVQSL